MKTAHDPRHQNRIHEMEELFSYSFDPTHDTFSHISELIIHLPELDAKIQAAAPEWPIDKIAKIDLSILRLSSWELLINKKEPPKVIIDEAVELAKAYGNVNSAKFVNGVLGKLFSEDKPHDV